MSWLDKLSSGLKKSAEQLNISNLFNKKRLDDDILDEIEEMLISADLGVSKASEIVSNMKSEKFHKEVTDKEIKEFLSNQIASSLEPHAKSIALDKNRLNVILMVGVNGSGKTTTIGKLANKWSNLGYGVKIAACDTFRAAAIDQMKEWADRAGVEIITASPGSDPAALAHRAVRLCLDDNTTDILLIDTAGRLQNKTHLMDELAKIRRVINKIDSHFPSHTILVLDATTGQNTISQVETFKESANINGLIMTKLDGSAKGGVLINIVDSYSIPIYYIGVGESEDDLLEFNYRDFANKLVGIEDDK